MHYPVMEFTLTPVTGVYQGVTDWSLDLHKWGLVSDFTGTANNLQQPLTNSLGIQVFPLSLIGL